MYPFGEVHPCYGRPGVLTHHGEDRKSYIASNAIVNRLNDEQVMEKICG